MNELEAEKETLTDRLSDISKEPQVIEIHPNLPLIFAERIGKLQEAFDKEGIRSEAAELLQGVVEKIVLTPSTEAEDG